MLHSPNEGKCAPTVEVFSSISHRAPGTSSEQCRYISDWRRMSLKQYVRSHRLPPFHQVRHRLEKVVVFSLKENGACEKSLGSPSGEPFKRHWEREMALGRAGELGGKSQKRNC